MLKKLIIVLFLVFTQTMAESRQNNGDSADFTPIADSTNAVDSAIFSQMRDSADFMDSTNPTQNTSDSTNLIDSTQTQDSTNSANLVDSADSTNIADSALSTQTNIFHNNTFFVGIELGYMKFSYDELGTIGTNTAQRPISNGAFNMGVIWGYRHFFVDSIGVRGYANMNYLYNKDNKISHFSELKILNLGVNADFMLNFYTNNHFDMGVFFGIGFGGDIFAGKGLADIRKYASGVNLSGISVGLNMGVQSLICEKVGIEFIAKIPLMSHYFVNKDKFTKRKLSQNYALSGRILYYF